MTAAEISLALSVPVESVRKAADGPGISPVGDLYADAGAAQAARDRLIEALRRRADERPEEPEITIAEARAATGLGTPLADALLDEMAGAEIHVTETGVSLPDAGGVSEELEREARALLQSLEAAGVEPPTTEPGPPLRLLLKRGDAVDLGGGLYAASKIAERVLDLTKSVCREEGEISLAGLRDRLGTSRRFAQAWLEFSDASGVTVRTGDVRVLTRKHR